MGKTVRKENWKLQDRDFEINFSFTLNLYLFMFAKNMPVLNITEMFILVLK